MALLPSVRPFFQSGFRLHSGEAMNQILGSLFGFVSGGNGVDTAFGKNLLTSAATGLTAHSGGTQAAALLLIADTNVVSTVAAAGDSVALPLGVAGMGITVSNQATTNSMNVYVAAGSTDTINAVATGTAFAITHGLSTTFYCSGVVAGVGIWVAQAAS